MRSKNKSVTLSSILVAVSGQKSDDAAVKLACKLLHHQHGSLFIVYVIEISRKLPLDAENTTATLEGEKVLASMEDIVKTYKFTKRAELLQSREAGFALVQEAVNRNVEAIVLGSPYLQKYGSFSMGKTIPYVLEYSPCRVIICRDSMG